MPTEQTYLLFLNASLPTPAHVQGIAGLDHPPLARPVEKVTKEYKEDIENDGQGKDEAMIGNTEEIKDEEHVEPPGHEDDSSPLQFCVLITLSTLHRLQSWSRTQTPQKPLGLIIAMATTASASLTHAPHTYPWPYFLYGTLAEPDVLANKLGSEGQLPVLRRARVKGWKVRGWGQYGAMVRDDGGEEVVVQGVVYEVGGVGEVQGMAAWMGDRYEVVRMGIQMEGDGGEEVEGYAFVWCGDEGELN